MYMEHELNSQGTKKQEMDAYAAEVYARKHISRAGLWLATASIVGLFFHPFDAHLVSAFVGFLVCGLGMYGMSLTSPPHHLKTEGTRKNHISLSTEASKEEQRKSSRGDASMFKNTATRSFWIALNSELISLEEKGKQSNEAEKYEQGVRLLALEKLANLAKLNPQVTLDEYVAHCRAGFELAWEHMAEYERAQWIIVLWQVKQTQRSQ